jgi:hypothetical protein
MVAWLTEDRNRSELIYSTSGVSAASAPTMDAVDFSSYFAPVLYYAFTGAAGTFTATMRVETSIDNSAWTQISASAAPVTGNITEWIPVVDTLSKYPGPYVRVRWTEDTGSITNGNLAIQLYGRKLVPT